MSVKLKFGARALLAITALTLIGCEAEPLTPEQNERLERVFSDMPHERATGVVQNMRFSGYYEGDLSLQWSPALAQAINQVHFDLDFVEERYDLETDGGAAALLQDLSYTDIRPRLASELMVDPAPFIQTDPISIEATSNGRKCSIAGGSYSRNGEMLHLTFYKVGGQAGFNLNWDGWPSSNFPRIISVRFGEQTLPMMVEYDYSAPVVHASVFNVNDHWVIDGMKRATELEIGEGTEIAPLKIPTGDLYQAALALDQCG